MRLNGLAVSNVIGEKLPMFVIGKSPNPRCFKNIKSLPCKHKSQPKRWVNQLDRTMVEEGREIALTVDNCSTHITGMKLLHCR